jgi:hypothetical protein
MGYICPWHKGERYPDASTIGFIRKTNVSHLIKICGGLKQTQKALRLISAQRFETYKIIR